MPGFGSDNCAGAHPEVVAAIAAANDGYARAYGEDRWTAAAEALLREHFGAQATSFLVFNGTGANVLCLRAMARPWEAVLCADSAHLAVSECGAPERIGGVKLLTAATPDGKLTPELLAPLRTRLGDPHAVQPRVVSVSQSTELGTCYTPDELRAIAEWAHGHGLLLHLDGSRLANAAAALDLPLRALSTDVGVDAVSFGGTKNGLVFGEAVVLLRPELADGVAYLRKQSLQLASKMRFAAAQMQALLEGDLWRRGAAHANAMARRLAGAIEALPGVEVTQPVEANAVFAVVPAPAAARLAEQFDVQLWDPPRGEVRCMCAWDTTAEDVDALVRTLAGST